MKEEYKQFHTSSRYDWHVSNLGNIRRINNGKINNGKVKQIKSYGIGGQGGSTYQAISINDAPEKYVHRIVATMFIPNPNGKLAVNHIDCDKTNNHVDNLEWVTYAENMKHATENDINTTKSRKLTFEQAQDIRELWATSDFRLVDLAKMYGVYSQTIKQIRDNKTYTEDV